MTAAQCITMTHEEVDKALATMSIAEQEQLANDLEQLAAHYQSIANKVEADMQRATEISNFESDSMMFLVSRKQAYERLGLHLDNGSRILFVVSDDKELKPEEVCSKVKGKDFNSYHDERLHENPPF